MPSESQAQNRLMQAAAEGEVKGVPASVGKEFIKADAGRAIKKLPEHVKSSAKQPGGYPSKSNHSRSGGYK